MALDHTLVLPSEECIGPVTGELMGRWGAEPLTLRGASDRPAFGEAGLAVTRPHTPGGTTPPGMPVSLTASGWGRPTPTHERQRVG